MNLLVDDLSVCLHHHYLMRTKTHTHRIIDANQRLSSYLCRIKFIIIVFLFVFFILKEHMLQILYRLNCRRKFWKCSLSLSRSRILTVRLLPLPTVEISSCLHVAFDHWMFHRNLVLYYEISSSFVQTNQI